MANTKLNRTASSTGNRRTWTWSGWVKRSAVIGTTDAKGGLFSTYTDGNNRFDFGIDGNHRFFLKEKEGSGATVIDFTTNRLFLDPSAFYHFVIAMDTTQSTASNRLKIYLNGEQITSWLDSTYPSQNRDTLMNVSGRTYIIGSTDGSSNYWNGLMSHVHFCDGTALAPTVFGSTDSTTGQWKINTAPTFTPGTNGFTILKDGKTITDQSSNSNNFSLGGGTLTKTEDCPNNVFATLNPLAPSASGLDIRNGNTHVFNDDDNNAFQTVPATLAIPPTAKIYWEIKCVTVWGSANCENHGITDLDNTIQALTGQASANANSFAWRNNASFVTGGSVISGTTWASSYTTGDFLMFALDNANGALYAGKNGTWLNSGNPTSGSSKTGALSVTAGLNYAPHSELKYGSDKPAYNFGNGHFVTTAISSAGTNASGNGIFEYAVPSGYTALSTKGLNL